MDERIDISIIIPTFNGKNSLEELCRRITNTMAELKSIYEIIFVDDGSTDTSLEILKVLHQKDKRIKIIKLSNNFGQYNAIFAGMNQSRGEIVVVIDDDLEYAPEDIPKILEKIYEGYDFVSGWRKTKNKPLLTRKIPSLILNLLISICIGRRVHDFGCGLKAWGKEIVKEFIEKKEFPPSVFHIQKTRFIEVPIFSGRKNVRSKTNSIKLFKNGIKVVFGMLDEKVILFRWACQFIKRAYKSNYTIEEIIQ